MRPFCDTTEGVFAEEVVDVELGADGGGAAGFSWNRKKYQSMHVSRNDASYVITIIFGKTCGEEKLICLLL